MAEPGSAPHPNGVNPRRVRYYSGLVRAMKIALPVAALGLIAAMFLDSREPGDPTDLFSVDDLATLGAGLKLDNPRFDGVTKKGEPFHVEADYAVPDSALPKIIELEKPRGEIELADGRVVTATSRTGTMLREQKMLVLKETVELGTSDGYHMATERLEIDMDGKTARSPGPVTARGPRGDIAAGSLRAEAGPPGGGAGKIWFENRVRLVFIPATGGE
jgi:lipopolysaccharide export system protein LptC